MLCTIILNSSVMLERFIDLKRPRFQSPYHLPSSLPHTAAAAASQAKLEELHWAALDYALSNPHLLLCDFQKDLGGKNVFQ